MPLSFAVSSLEQRMVDAEADALVLRVLAGDETAWPQLWQTVEPRLYLTLRKRFFLGRLSDSEDDCRNIIVNVMARLKENDFARLHAYHEARRASPGLPFMAWLIIVAKRVAIDYMRQHDEYVDRRGEKDASTPGAWVVIETLVGNSRSPGGKAGLTDKAAAREIMAHAADLPEAQRIALGAWLEGNTFEEIARAQALGAPRDAERAVRAALERLRRRVRPAGGTP